MKKISLIVLLALFVVLAAAGTALAADLPTTYWTDHAASSFAEGSGTPGAPYQIRTAAELALLAEDSQYWDSHFILMDSINMSDHLWTPISTITEPFSGSFDGNWHVISNLTINNSGNSGTGFFSWIKDGQLYNLALTDAVVYGGAYTAVLVGCITGEDAELARCAVMNSTVSGRNTLGSIAASITEDAVVHDCFVQNSNVSSTSAFGAFVGSVFGSLTNESEVSCCYAIDSQPANNAGTISSGNPSSSNVYSSNEVVDLFYDSASGRYDFPEEFSANSGWEIAGNGLPVFKNTPIDDNYYLKVINGSGSGYYEMGDRVTIKADKAPRGQIFSYWEADGVKLTDKYSAKTTFRMPGHNVTVIAHYEKDETWLAGVGEKQDVPYINGYPDGSFRPDNLIKRSEAAKMFAYAAGYPNTQAATGAYADMSHGEWYHSYVALMTQKGVITGYEDSTFRADGNITRAEFVAMVCRLASKNYTSVRAPYGDTANHWANGYIDIAYANGWLADFSGSNFSPDQAVTRGEAVQILNRMLGRDQMIFVQTSADFSDVPATHPLYDAIKRASSVMK